MSRQILKDGKLVCDPWVFLEDGQTAPADSLLILPLERWLEETKHKEDETAYPGVVLANTDPLEALVPKLHRIKLICIEFPDAVDGRGYSQASLLRNRHGYKNELRAIGDVQVDQLFLLSRCGFDSFALNPDQGSACPSSYYRHFQWLINRKVQGNKTMIDDLAAINRSLENKSAEQIINWALGLSENTITSTTFGNQSAALLHMVAQQKHDATILWVDTGYNTPATYRFADKIIERLDLNMQIYSPEMTSVRRNVIMGGIPDIDDPLHKEFTHQVKLEPFNRATNALRTMVWITGLRRDQNEHRKSLDIVSRTKEGYMKVAPLLNWDESRIDAYIEQHDLPNEPDYFDPTKVLESRECGLHISQ